MYSVKTGIEKWHLILNNDVVEGFMVTIVT